MSSADETATYELLIESQAGVVPGPGIRSWPIPESLAIEAPPWLGWLACVPPKRLVRGLSVIALAIGFVVIGGGNLDPGEIEARLGIAAQEPLGPLGQVFGGWEPSLWPAPVTLSRIWARCGGGTPSAASIRWPAAIAGVLTGFVLTRRMFRTLGAGASVLMGLSWFGSIALIDRSAGAGLDLVMGLGTIAALDRLLTRGSDLGAGLWASLAFLAGGWPPVALLALVTVVIGRREAGLKARLLVPPCLTAAAWSAWALSQMQAAAWAAALTLPLTQKPAWLLAPGVFGLALPWSPLILLAATRSIRTGWPPAARSLCVGWFRAAVACLLIGTLIPGFALAARLPAVAGLAVVAAACVHRVWAGPVAPAVRRGFLVLVALVVGFWLVLVNGAAIFLASAVPFYRGLAIGLIAVSLLIGLVCLTALFRGDVRRGLLALTAVAVCLKIAHWGYYVPEWNYRHGQGPWGRAIGQWVVPAWPIYTVHAWPPALAFATEHPFRQLRHPKSLAFQDGPTPRFVLLFDSEFDHWPETALPLVKVATFQDDRGSTRVLARTAGPFSWKMLVRNRQDDERVR
jgi:hypothetical protein